MTAANISLNATVMANRAVYIVCNVPTAGSGGYAPITVPVPEVFSP
jgi:hypothetical protein